MNTIQQRIVTDPNGLYLSKSEDKVLAMNTIEVRIKKTSFVMCENGQDKLNMLDATLLKDPANKSFRIFQRREISESWDEQSNFTGNWELGAVEYVESRRSE